MMRVWGGWISVCKLTKVSVTVTDQRDSGDLVGVLAVLI